MTLQQPFSIMASEYLDKAWIKSGGFRAQFRSTPEARETANKMVATLNAHDDLVKALEAIVSECLSEDGTDTEEIFSLASTALRKAAS